MKRLWFVLGYILVVVCFSLGARDLQKEPPLIYPASVSFGTVTMGTIAKTSFILTNTGREDLHIESMTSSCGCTSAQAKIDTIPASGNVEVFVTVDTIQKLGHIQKTLKITLADYRLPLSVLVEGIVTIPVMQHDNTKGVSIFSEKCISCHTQQGENRQGLSLYLADCAMCHGTTLQGASGPALRHYKPEWMEIIKHGSIAMSAFSKDRGGPLSEDQLTSLQFFLEHGTTKKSDWSSFRLYFEYCSPCHGELRMGPIGPNIEPEKLAHINKNNLVKMLIDGTKNPLMPSFSSQKNGWMSNEEIEKVANFLKGN